MDLSYIRLHIRTFHTFVYTYGPFIHLFTHIYTGVKIKRPYFIAIKPISLQYLHRSALKRTRLERGTRNHNSKYFSTQLDRKSGT